jgi:hypothetical protein
MTDETPTNQTPQGILFRKVPLDIPESHIITFGLSPEEAKKNPHYSAAKAGDGSAAILLVKTLVPKFLDTELSRVFSPGTIFTAPHAEEAKGRNAIPAILSTYCAAVCDGEADDEIIQINRAFHTGADMAQRLVSRVGFDGEVLAGRNYVLVDDNLTSGGTLADFGSFITYAGARVIGLVVLTVSDRYSTFCPTRKAVDTLEKHYEPGKFKSICGNLGINRNAFTDAEVRYLFGFRTADELGNRIVKAKQERADRLREKGVRPIEEK